jgi:hypothetical protein
MSTVAIVTNRDCGFAPGHNLTEETYFQKPSTATIAGARRSGSPASSAHRVPGMRHLGLNSGMTKVRIAM